MVISSLFQSQVFTQPTATILTAQLDQDIPSVKVITSGRTTNVTKGFDLAQKESNRLSTTPRSQSPASGRVTPVTVQTTTVEQSGDYQKKERDNALALYKKERGGNKDSLYMVVIGHVDAGKSTLMGHLLFELGQVCGFIFRKKKTTH